MDKREFISTLIKGLVMVPFISPTLAAANYTPKQRKLNVLMLGGRGFLGPTIVRTFLKEGHKVTLLNRGLTNPHLFKNLPFIQCDREKENKVGLVAVKDKINEYKWDCVIDTWQKSPKAVTDFLEEFGHQISQYHYISSLAVYDKWDKKGISEDDKLTPVPEFPRTISQEYRYAVRKTFCEISIMETLDLNWTIYRCHGIRSDRLPDPKDPHEEPYWPIRFLQGGDILLPDVEDHHIQMTDAKSLSKFIMSCAENSVTGKFNVAYPPIPFKEYIKSLLQVTNEEANLHWIPENFLIENDVQPYKEIEYWSRSIGAYYFSVEKAISKGLINRPLEEMLSDQIAGYRRRYPDEDFQFGGSFNGTVVKLSPKKEKSILTKWFERQ